LAALAAALEASFRLLRRLLVLVALAYLASGFFIVRQDESALVQVGGRLRGGEAGRALGPGLHWTWPRPFARVTRVPTGVQDIRTDAFWPEDPGLRAGLPPDQLPPPPPTLHPRRDGYLLSADASLFHARLAARVRVTDPVRHRLAFRDPERLLENELRRVALRAAARTPVDEALRGDSETFRKHLEDLLRDRCARLGLGVEVQRVDLLTAPPRQASKAFQSLVEARLESSRTVEQARARAERLRQEAGGEVDRVLARAQAEKARRVAETAASVARFRAVLARYRENPLIVGELLRQETLARGLAKVGERVVVPATQSGEELRLHIPRLPAPRPSLPEASP
jgi:regulator of protease activity HflC (stomatin/prohibitin superfamily)